MSRRFVKTTSEMEGRVTEVWTLVDDEDGLEQWPDNGDALLVVGRPTPRQDGLQRAAGRANYTVDIRLAGMLYAAVLRSPLPTPRCDRSTSTQPGARTAFAASSAPIPMSRLRRIFARRTRSRHPGRPTRVRR